MKRYIEKLKIGNLYKTRHYKKWLVYLGTLRTYDVNTGFYLYHVFVKDGTKTVLMYKNIRKLFWAEDGEADEQKVTMEDIKRKYPEIPEGVRIDRIELTKGITPNVYSVSTENHSALLVEHTSREIQLVRVVILYPNFQIVNKRQLDSKITVPITIEMFCRMSLVLEGDGNIKRIKNDWIKYSPNRLCGKRICLLSNKNDQCELDVIFSNGDRVTVKKQIYPQFDYAADYIYHNELKGFLKFDLP